MVTFIGNVMILQLKL